MPGLDQTGPLGLGPMTGGSYGRCTGAVGRGSWRRPRSGFGRPAVDFMAAPCLPGWAGYGRGHRHRFYATGIPFSAYGSAATPELDPEQEVSYLKAQAARLRGLLDEIERRLREYGSEQSRPE